MFLKPEMPSVMNEISMRRYTADTFAIRNSNSQLSQSPENCEARTNFGTVLKNKIEEDDFCFIKLENVKTPSMLGKRKLDLNSEQKPEAGNMTFHKASAKRLRLLD